MALIATLPWYDLPATSNNMDTLWLAIRRELCGLNELFRDSLPDALERDSDLVEIWQRPELILSQCCGPDLFTPQAAALEPIARPVFNRLYCTPGDYFSHIVSAASKLPEHPRLVINSLTSRSGCFALIEWLESQGIKPASIEVSGSHQESINWLLNGKADLAAIDAQSWLFLTTQQLIIIGQSRPAPAPPFVMHRDSPLSEHSVYNALERAVIVYGEQLSLGGLMHADRELYRPLADQQVMPAQMGNQSHPESDLSAVPA